MSDTQTQPTSAEALAALSAAAAQASKSEEPTEWYVIDDTATEDVYTEAGAVISGTRTHQMNVDGKIRPFRFKFGEGTPMPPAVAIKFLATDTFRLVDKDGRDREWRNPPRQPGSLQAGERFQLADDQTVAGYHELTVEALRVRSLQIAGGEGIPRTAKKEDIIAFIVRSTVEKRRATTVDEGAELAAAGFQDVDPDGDDFFATNV